MSMSGIATAPIARSVQFFRPDPSADDEQYQAVIDRSIIAAGFMIGAWLLSVPGTLLLVHAWRLHRDGRKAGRSLRPAIISIIGFICLIDGLLNFFLWVFDMTWAHDTVIIHSVYTAFGQLWDGAYYLGYNTTRAGGTAVPSEKSIEIAGTLVMYPMHTVAAIGLLKMRRWGYTYTLVSSWIYVFFWFFYLTQLIAEFQWRFPNTAWGVLGWWFIDLPFINPFFLIPILHSFDRELWTDAGARRARLGQRKSHRLKRVA